jgi:hypothetical protein
LNSTSIITYLSFDGCAALDLRTRESNWSHKGKRFGSGKASSLLLLFMLSWFMLSRGGNERSLPAVDGDGCVMPLDTAFECFAADDCDRTW